MVSKVFQNIVLQIKEATDRTVGVIDSDGTVVASSELSLVGTKLGKIPEHTDGQNAGALPAAASTPAVTCGGNSFKQLKQNEPGGYTVFVSGEDELSKITCVTAAIAISQAGAVFEDSFDKSAFVKTIITDNILPGEVAARANDMRFTPDVERGVLVIRTESVLLAQAVDIMRKTFPDKQNDYIITIGDTDIVLVKEMPPEGDTEYLTDLAKMINTKLEAGLGKSGVIGIGTPASELRELADRYRQAIVSIDIGRVFETGSMIISYENLGISRLIYQLPITLCEIYLSEVFKHNPIEALDTETLFTIDKFFENSLNVSETARKLYVHRNTLVYRLDKIKKITGLDIREFDHAIVFKVALMVKKYLISQEIK